jgi:hypothetical protein
MKHCQSCSHRIESKWFDLMIVGLAQEIEPRFSALILHVVCETLLLATSQAFQGNRYFMSYYQMK